MSYEEIQIPEEPDRAVQRAVGITPRWHETLGSVGGVLGVAPAVDLRGIQMLAPYQRK